MTDATRRPGAAPEPEDDRAAAALRAALGRHADDGDFAPLDPEALALQARIRAGQQPAPDAEVTSAATVTADELARRRARRERRRLLAAAAVVVVAAPLGVWFVTQSMSPGGGFTAQAPAAQAGPAASAAPDAQAREDGTGPAAGTGRSTGVAGTQSTPAGASGLPAPQPGHRYASYLDVVVQVPASWGYANAPGSDWCVGGSRVPSPYVGLNPNGPRAAVLCQGDIPEDRQQTHLEWRLAAAAPPTPRPDEYTANGWVYSSRTVGSVYLTVVHRPGEDASAILASARRVTQDHNGCPVTGPAPTARPAATGGLAGAQEVVLCQYDDAIRSPNLTTSTRLSGAAASGLVAAIDASEPAAGIGTVPQCLPGDHDLTRVVARSAGGEAWLSLGGCRVPTWDDGATYRASSRAACTAAFTEPLARFAWDQVSDAVCGPGPLPATPTRSPR